VVCKLYLNKKCYQEELRKIKQGKESERGSVKDTMVRKDKVGAIDCLLALPLTHHGSRLGPVSSACFQHLPCSESVPKCFVP
jgi:hypothetical protein